MNIIPTFYPSQNFDVFLKDAHHTCYMATCDDVYFKQFAPSLIDSFHKFKVGNLNEILLINIINPSLDSILLAEKINIMYEEIEINFSIAEELHKLSDEQKRTYYSIHRFLLLPEILINFHSVIIVDIDCIFRELSRKIFNVGEEIGIFFTEPLQTNDWEREGSRVGAGCFYVKNTNTGRSFVNSIKEKILNNYILMWFIDQRCIWDAYQELENKNEVLRLDTLNFMDWEFKDNSYIWTGRGPRKYNDEKYLKSFNKHKYNFYQSLL